MPDDEHKFDPNFKWCVGLSIAAFIFCIISFVSPTWIESFQEYNSQFTRLGLWVACFNGYIHPEDYVSKSYYGCWYIYWPEYDYIRSWLNPGWFYAVQMLASLSLICNGLAFIFLILVLVDAKKVNDRMNNICILILIIVASCCHIIDIVAMGVMSRDREWLPRPDQNHVSWGYAFAVLAGFCSVFCTFHIIMHYLKYNWAPDKIKKLMKHEDPNVEKNILLESAIGGGGGSTIYNKSHLGSGYNPGGAGGISTIYSHGPKQPASHYGGLTSGASASAKVREAMTQKANQQGSMSSLNMLKNRTGSQHSLASMGRGSNVGGGSQLNGRGGGPGGDFRGSMSSLHSTTRRPRTPVQNDDDVIV